MARDYGTRRTARQKSSAPHQLLVVTVTFLLGYLTATFFDVQTISTWMNTQVLANHQKQQSPSKPEPQQAQVPPKPKFEFYTLLANEKGGTRPATNSNANHSAPVKTSTPPAPTSPVTNGAAAITTAARNTVKPTTSTTTQPAAVKIAEGRALAPASVSKGNYMVQVAAFKVRQDAEHMKGLLTLKGFNVNVVPVTNAHGNWFRVVVGPYLNKVLAQKAQITLAKNERLRGMIIGG